MKLFNTMKTKISVQGQLLFGVSPREKTVVRCSSTRELLFSFQAAEIILKNRPFFFSQWICLHEVYRYDHQDMYIVYPRHSLFRKGEKKFWITKLLKNAHIYYGYLPLNKFSIRRSNLSPSFSPSLFQNSWSWNWRFCSNRYCKTM